MDSIQSRGSPVPNVEDQRETRYYVPSVLRNLWVYQGMARSDAPTLSALAQHRWPSFPNSRTNLAAATELRQPGEP